MTFSIILFSEFYPMIIPTQFLDFLWEAFQWKNLMYLSPCFSKKKKIYQYCALRSQCACYLLIFFSLVLFLSFAPFLANSVLTLTICFFPSCHHFQPLPIISSIIWQISRCFLLFPLFFSTLHYSLPPPCFNPNHHTWHTPPLPLYCIQVESSLYLLFLLIVLELWYSLLLYACCVAFALKT